MLVASDDEQSEERIKEIQAEEAKYLNALQAWVARKRDHDARHRAEGKEPPDYEKTVERPPDPPEFVARPQIEIEEGPGGWTVVREKTNKWGNRLTVLRNHDQYKVSGAHLSRAVETSDVQGRPAVAFGLNRAGATKLANITGANKGGLLAIVLDGKIRQVAMIVGRIYDSVELSGSFSPKEVREIVTLLKDGGTSRSR